MKATLRALTDARWTTAAFAVAGFAVTLLQSLAYFPMAGHTLAQRAAFGYSLLLEATANAALFPAPIHPETVAGYLELRAFEPLAILFAAWALMSATASTSIPILARASAFAVSTIVAAAAACAGAAIGVASGGESVGGLGLAAAGLLLVALAVACYAICLCVAQVAPNAPAIAGGLLLSLFFLNSLSRIFSGLAAARWLSPFRYYDLSAPLPEGGRFDVAGFVVLLAIASAGTGAAVLIATRRIAAPVLRRSTYQPSRTRGFLAAPVARELYARRIVLASWCVGLTVLTVLLVAATQTTMQSLLALPRILPGLPQYIVVVYEEVLGQTWFEVMLLLLAALVFAFTRRWAADDREGRLEAALSAPYSRSALLLERLAALALIAGVVAVLSGLAAGLTSRWANLALDPAHVAAAGLVLVLFGLVLGAAGLVFTSWAPRAAGTLFIAFVLAGYLDDQVGGALGLPGWVQSIGPFRLADSPLANGVEGRNVALLALLACAGVGISILLMQRRDVGA
ncbi:MAG TPA: hypothetical protein VFL27_02165 [Candidatus Dormibacteraeota bacterium]|nr:hypothetical protein [Candidatus Dormibacteraeota bacterium]